MYFLETVSKMYPSPYLTMQNRLRNVHVHLDERREDDVLLLLEPVHDCGGGASGDPNLCHAEMKLADFLQGSRLADF